MQEKPSIKEEVDLIAVSHEECGSGEASERRKCLAERAMSLQSQRSSLRFQLASATRAAIQGLDSGLTPDVTRIGGQNGEVLSPALISALGQELNADHDAELGLMSLYKLQSSLRQLEKHMRGGDRARHNMDVHLLSHETAQAVELCRQAIGLSSTLTSNLNCENSDAATNEEKVDCVPFLTHPSIKFHCSTLIKRTESMGKALKKLISDGIQFVLQKCDWPPPFLEADTTEQNELQLESLVSRWNGFDSSNPNFLYLQQLAMTQISLQQILEHEAFSRYADEKHTLGKSVTQNLPPQLWLGEDLAKCVGSWLQHHFASGLPTDRPEKPEWLFAAAIKATQQCCKYVEALQPCINAHNMELIYSIQFEVARAIGVYAVGDVLKSHVLPRLAEMKDSPSWLHYVDEAIRFDDNLAPFKGVVMNPQNMESEVLSLGLWFLPESVLNVAFENKVWTEQWLSAEREDASSQLASALEGFELHSLHGIGSAMDMANHDVSVATAVSSSKASQLETINSSVSEEVVNILVNLVRRGMKVPPGVARRNYFWEQVLVAIIKEFAHQSSSEMIRAEQFHHLLDDIGLPRIGFILCTIHSIEHSIREPAGFLLAACATDEHLSQLLAHEADYLAHLRRQWTYKVAKMGIEEFKKSMSKYTRQLQVLASQDEDEACTTSLVIDQPSPALLAAASVLYSLLDKFSIHLDAVLFRDIWRALALSVNQTIVHDIAMEVRFTQNSSQQFAVDVDNLVAVFKSCTSRPASHFKESKEACFLLGLPSDEARLIAQHGTSSAKESREFLTNAGVRALNGDQVVSILHSRADFDVN